ncbi:MAG: hypothetical protein AAGI88_18750 [Pseudomonadota bacterium]
MAALTESAEALIRTLRLAQLRYQAGQTNRMNVPLVVANTLSVDGALVAVRREQLDQRIELNPAHVVVWY